MWLKGEPCPRAGWRNALIDSAAAREFGELRELLLANAPRFSVASFFIAAYLLQDAPCRVHYAREQLQGLLLPLSVSHMRVARVGRRCLGLAGATPRWLGRQVHQNMMSALMLPPEPHAECCSVSRLVRFHDRPSRAAVRRVRTVDAIWLQPVLTVDRTRGAVDEKLGSDQYPTYINSVSFNFLSHMCTVANICVHLTICNP